jgi:nucleoside-diphosphate-sugar epimerase
MADKKTCVVAGGAGFIGSHLCDSLLQSGYKVFAIDNLITGTEDNLFEAKKNPDFTFIKWDITDQLPVLGQIDAVFHLASPASVPDYQEYPKETALVNSLGTMNLLDVAKAYDATFLFASTSEVYGDPKEHPQKETYWGNVNPNGVRACYDESKRYGEMMTMLYTNKYAVDGRIIRIFNTYGPRMRPTDGRVVSNFINQAIANEPLTVYGDGKQTRSFCFVSDLVSGIMKAIFGKGTKGEVINLGNPDERSILEFAQIIQKMTKTASKIEFTELPKDDPTVRCPDITKAQTKLGWKPAVTLNDGLLQTIAYYRSLKHS